MKTVFILLFGFITVSVYAQDETKVFLFNKDWGPAQNMKQATYFMHEVKENDTVYVCRYYRKEGPMVKWETYRDSLGEIPNGTFAWYNAKGRLDSMGTVTNGRKDRKWLYNMDDSGHARIEEYFENGHFKSRTDYISRTVTLADGSTEPLKPKPLDTIPAKTVKRVQREAVFPGGLSAWGAYLTGNLHTPKRLVDISRPNTKATVVVEFIVSKTGKIDGLFIWQSYEWSADYEAMRVIKEGPDWTPAEQDGKAVFYRHRQSITYQIGY